MDYAVPYMTRYMFLTQVPKVGTNMVGTIIVLCCFVKLLHCQKRQEVANRNLLIIPHTSCFIWRTNEAYQVSTIYKAPIISILKFIYKVQLLLPPCRRSARGRKASLVLGAQEGVHFNRQNIISV